MRYGFFLKLYLYIFTNVYVVWSVVKIVTYYEKYNLILELKHHFVNISGYEHELTEVHFVWSSEAVHYKNVHTVNTCTTNNFFEMMYSTLIITFTVRFMQTYFLSSFLYLPAHFIVEACVILNMSIHYEIKVNCRRTQCCC